MPLGLDFPPILLGLGSQVGSKNSPGALQNRIKIEPQLQHRFGSVLGASWVEKPQKKTVFNIEREARLRLKHRGNTFQQLFPGNLRECLVETSINILLHLQRSARVARCARSLATRAQPFLTVFLYVLDNKKSIKNQRKPT